MEEIHEMQETKDCQKKSMKSRKFQEIHKSKIAQKSTTIQ